MRSIMVKISNAWGKARPPRKSHSGHAPGTTHAARSLGMAGGRRTRRRLLLLKVMFQELYGVPLCGTQRDRDDEAKRRADQALSGFLLRLGILDDLAHLGDVRLGRDVRWNR